MIRSLPLLESTDPGSSAFLGRAPQGWPCAHAGGAQHPRPGAAREPARDESLYEELEAALLQADCGVAATQAIVSSLRRKKLETRRPCDAR